jgi:hypothetical protein
MSALEVELLALEAAREKALVDELVGLVNEA